MRTPCLSLVLGLLVATSFAVTGCSSPMPDDEESLAASEDGLSLAPQNSGYWIVTRRDVRKCAAPLCGGYWVKRVNQDLSTCADGKKAAECYVDAVQLTGVGLSTREEDEARGSVESGQAFVKARLYKKKAFGRTVGTLKANEVWVGATGSSAVDATFYRAADNGIRCITTPCNSTTAYELNTQDEQQLHAVHLDGTENPADSATLDRASQAIGTEEGLMVAGGIALPKCIPNSNCGPMLMASEFYFRVVRREGKSCGARATAFCNAGQFCQWKVGDICGAADAAGKCAYKPEICTRIYSPVCGCDDKTYSNACEAAAAGMSVSSQGECAAQTP